MVFLGRTTILAQTIGDTRNENPVTHRVVHTFKIKGTVWPAGEHEWSRNETLNNLCYGNSNNNSHWTSPFSSIYTTLWQVFVEPEQTCTVPVGKIGWIEDTKTYTVYSESNLTEAATEILGGEIYMLVWNGAFELKWVPFAWTRNEITWSGRSAKEVIENASSGNGGGG